MADISNIRTLEDLTNVVSQLYFNLNNIERLYYDIFINPTPMTLELERYDENGVLGTITLDNRAKDRQNSYSGIGNPNGSQVGRTGSLYVDTSTLSLYYKSAGTDAYGWIEIWSSQNFRNGFQYLSPTGNGSQVTQLDASNISSGILSVANGGTGTQNISGLVKANGLSPYTAAVDGVDYLGSGSTTGIICYYPTATIPNGWLRCDGAAYSRTNYARLFSKIGTTYGDGDGSTTFNIPNLMDYFIRCWDGSRNFAEPQADQVGTHDHRFSGTTSSNGNHKHTIQNMPNFNYMPRGDDRLNCVSFSIVGETDYAGEHTHTFSGTTGVNAANQETRVKNIALVPIIKY